MYYISVLKNGSTNSKKRCDLATPANSRDNGLKRTHSLTTTNEAHKQHIGVCVSLVLDRGDRIYAHQQQLKRSSFRCGRYRYGPLRYRRRCRSVFSHFTVHVQSNMKQPKSRHISCALRSQLRRSTHFRRGLVCVAPGLENSVSRDYAHSPPNSSLW